MAGTLSHLHYLLFGLYLTPKYKPMPEGVLGIDSLASLPNWRTNPDGLTEKQRNARGYQLLGPKYYVLFEQGRFNQLTECFLREYWPNKAAGIKQAWSVTRVTESPLAFAKFLTEAITAGASKSFLRDDKSVQSFIEVWPQMAALVED